MKVWELMAELSKRPAGDDVCVAHSGDSYLVRLESTDSDEGLVYLYGDGRFVVTEEAEKYPSRPAAKEEK